MNTHPHKYEIDTSATFSSTHTITTSQQNKSTQETL